MITFQPHPWNDGQIHVPHSDGSQVRMGLKPPSDFRLAEAFGKLFNGGNTRIFQYPNIGPVAQKNENNWGYPSKKQIE